MRSNPSLHSTSNRLMASALGEEPDLISEKARKCHVELGKDNPCPECYGWWLWYSTCDHKKYVCKACGRSQCLLHWKYPMQTEDEAIHFLKGAEVDSGKKCFIRRARVPTGGEKWKIFTSEEDYDSYVKSKKHKR